MLDKNKSYIRSYSSEYIEARVYYILSIKSKGIKARTNFIYDNLQINKIIEMNINIKAKNINEIILNLFGNKITFKMGIRPNPNPQFKQFININLK